MSNAANWAPAGGPPGTSDTAVFSTVNGFAQVDGTFNVGNVTNIRTGSGQTTIVGLNTSIDTLNISGNLTNQGTTFVLRQNSSNTLSVSVGGNMNLNTGSTTTFGGTTLNNNGRNITDVTVTGTTNLDGTLSFSQIVGTVNLGNVVMTNGTLNPISGTSEVNGTPNGNTANVINMNRLQGTGTIAGAKEGATQLTAGTIVVNGTVDGTFSGTIADGLTLNRLAFTKAGTSTQTLSGNNTYSGTTTVAAGTLLINGSHNGAGNYTVANTATLGGTGSIRPGSGAGITVQNGGFLAPGASIGSLTLDGAATASAVLTLASGAALNFELDASGGTPDRLIFWNYAGSSDFVLNNNTLNLSLVGTITPNTYIVPLFLFFSDGGDNATGSGLTSGLSLGSLGTNIESADLIWNSGNGTIDLQYTVIPEPSSVLLLGLGLAALMLRKRK